MEGFDPDQWSFPLDNTTRSAFSAVNHVTSSRRGCPQNTILTEVCGISKQSRVAPGGASPRPKSKVEGQFHCCICGATFTRKHSVKVHFVSCVDRNGNPEGKSWTDHPSIGIYKTRRVIPKQQTNRAVDQAQPTWYPSSSGLLLPSEVQASPDGPTTEESLTIDPGWLETIPGDLVMGGTTQPWPFLGESSRSGTISNGSHTVQPVVETEMQPDTGIMIRPGFAITNGEGHTISFDEYGFWTDGEKMWSPVM